MTIVDASLIAFIWLVGCISFVRCRGFHHPRLSSVEIQLQMIKEAHSGKEIPIQEAMQLTDKAIKRWNDDC